MPQMRFKKKHTKNADKLLFINLARLFLMLFSERDSPDKIRVSESIRKVKRTMCI